MRLINGLVMADGEKISGPYEDAMLVLEDKIIVPARGGVRLLDAFTGELVRDHPGFFRGWGNAEEYSVSKKVGEWFRACSRGLNLMPCGRRDPYPKCRTDTYDKTLKRKSSEVSKAAYGACS